MSHPFRVRNTEGFSLPGFHPGLSHFSPSANNHKQPRNLPLFSRLFIQGQVSNLPVLIVYIDSPRKPQKLRNIHMDIQDEQDKTAITMCKTWDKGTVTQYRARIPGGFETRPYRLEGSTRLFFFSSRLYGYLNGSYGSEHSENQWGFPRLLVYRRDAIYRVWMHFIHYYRFL